MDLADICSEARIRSLEDGEPSLEAELERMSSPVAVVCNGVLKPGAGKLIDAHPSVLRINYFRLAGFEEFCGERTTHWVTHGLRIYDPETPPLVQRLEGRLRKLLGRELLERRRRVLPEVPPHLPALVPLTWSRERVENLESIGRSPRFIKNTRYLLPFKELHPFPTTGFKISCMLLMFGKELSLFGMNGLAGMYYYGGESNRWRPHMPNAMRERELLAASSRIRFVDSAT